jgi:uncharacterized membrane protein YdcZ (DUF606 family)
MSMAGFSYYQVLFGGLGGAFAICANMLAIAAVGKINEKLPEGQRVSYIWWNADILAKYRRLSMVISFVVGASVLIVRGGW